MRLLRMAALLAAVGLVVTAVASNAEPGGPLRPHFPVQRYVAAHGIHKIKHVVIIMQENRSFDSYFGTYPGADGIPGLAGNPGTVPCLPQANPSDPCVQPFHDRYDRNYSGPHHQADSIYDIDGGKMDGFVIEQQSAEASCGCPSYPPNDAMGYHTRKDIPNYWKYADDFVLQDHMFGSVDSWSLPSHLYLVSLWSAHCTTRHPSSCTNSADNPGNPKGWDGATKAPTYAWTDLTYLLHKQHVSWRYFIFKGNEPPCESDPSLSCKPTTNGSTSLSVWNPLKYFVTVKHDHQVKEIQSVSHFFSDAQKGTLPAVSWVMPSQTVSDHPPQTVSAAQTYVTGLVNTVMQSPDWKSTAIFVVWDDWSGFYDHVNPPQIDENGYGLRVPALVISPYAKKGYIDHQTLSFDAYAKFIEDDFLGGQRLDPATDGRPDPRLDVREDAPQLGDLMLDFNFSQKPRKPVILNPHPKTDLREH